MSPLVVPFKKKMGIKRAERREGARADLSGAKRAPDSGVTIIFAPPPANIRYGLTVLIHNSGDFGPPLPFWAPGIAGAADG